ncbi:TIGR04104 family putative zinc finger protein [Faecalimicrobium sp. JNUCC 81]
MIKDCKICGKHYSIWEKYSIWSKYRFDNFRCKSCGSEYKIKKNNELYVFIYYLLVGFILINIFIEFFNFGTWLNFIMFIILNLMLHVITPFLLFYEQDFNFNKINKNT